MALVAGLLAVDPAHSQGDVLRQGQGFMVKPMRMETTAPAGQVVEVPLQIRNIAGAAVVAVDLRLVELSQTIDGSWRLIELDSAEDTSALYSSIHWTSLSDNRVEIAPLEPVEVIARLRVPASARGVYFAGIIAETPAPENTSGIFVRVRFLIPLIVHIQGRPVRQKVVLDDAAMTYKNEAGHPPTTTAHLVIANRGRTFSRVRGALRIERQSEDRWRPVTILEVPERGIIPGVTLELGGDLERRLPSGTYRLRGDLYVDGRRVAPIEKETVFAGDPNVDMLAYDTALTLEPQFVRMDVTPGATRTTVVRIENPGDDPVDVRMAAATPRSLVGVEMGDVQGIDLSAETWTEVRPAEFTLQPGRWQNVRVVCRIPRDGVDFPHYYADLILKGSYADGQSAGETRSTVELTNKLVGSTRDGVVDQLSLAEGDHPTEFVVQMRLGNTGNVHLEPSARAYVLDTQGRALRNIALSGDEGSLLPLGKRTFSGDLDLAGLEPGYYALKATASLAPGEEVSMQRVLLVEAGQPDASDETPPVISIIDPASVDIPASVVLPTDDEEQGSEGAGEGR